MKRIYRGLCGTNQPIWKFVGRDCATSPDELEWARVHATTSADEIDESVNDLIDVAVAVDGILQAQAASDADYFLKSCSRGFSGNDAQMIHQTVLKAYRWQYIVSGVEVERFQEALGSKVNDEQMQRITSALMPLITYVH